MAVKTTNTLSTDLVDYRADLDNIYVFPNGVQAITATTLNTVLDNLTYRLKDIIDSNFNKLTDDTDDVISGQRNRFVYVVETLTDRNNLNTDPLSPTVHGDLAFVTNENSLYQWDDTQWVMIYDIIGTELDVRVLDTPVSNQSAVNKQWVQYDSEMRIREWNDGGIVYKVNFNSGSLLIELIDGSTATIELTSGGISMTDTSISTLTASSATITDLTLNVPTYVDDTAAGIGGLATNKVYKTPSGELRIKL